MRHLFQTLMAGVCLLSASVFAQTSSGKAVTFVVPYAQAVAPTSWRA